MGSFLPLFFFYHCVMEGSKVRRRRRIHILLTALGVAGSAVAVSHSSLTQKVANEKFKGMVFTGPGSPPLDQSMFTSMAAVGGNFVALVPEATVYRQSLEVRYDFENQWYGEKTDATLVGMQLARLANLKVMLKPHLTVSWDMTGWESPDVDFEDPASRAVYLKSMRGYIETQTDKSNGKGSWRGDFDVKDEADWPRFAGNYRDFILEYARLAEEHAVELFCIGTEMKRIALRRPDFWRSLIWDVREVYSGQLLYAANWDSYDRIEFWDALDYIGIDAYFAVSDARTPSVEEIEHSWKRYHAQIEILQKRFAKPVVFTEWGYEDEDFAGMQPWIMGRVQLPEGSPVGTPKPNRTGQANAYEGMFRSFWSEPWMRGVFVWRWSPRSGGGGPSYSPRDKEAAIVMKRWFGQE